MNTAIFDDMVEYLKNNGWDESIEDDRFHIGRMAQAMCGYWNEKVTKIPPDNLPIMIDALKSARPFIVEQNIGFDVLAGEVIRKIDKALNTTL